MKELQEILDKPVQKTAFGYGDGKFYTADQVQEAFEAATDGLYERLEELHKAIAEDTNGFLYKRLSGILIKIKMDYAAPKTPYNHDQQ